MDKKNLGEIYIYYLNDKTRKTDGFIVRYPNTKYKKFMSKKLTLSEKYFLSYKYLRSQRLSV